MVAYPTESDLIDWVGASTSTELADLAEGIVDDVTDYWLSRIPTAALADAARPGGASPDCPARLRRVIVMDAGRIFSRRASRAGFELKADVVARIATADPDIARLSATLTNWPEA